MKVGYPPSAVAAAGVGHAAVALQAGRSAVVRAQARAPMKLLTPRDESPVARVVVSSFGGGIVAGDELALRLDVEADCRVILGTQASTKVFRSDGRAAKQRVEATIDEGAVLAVVPDPVTCFAGARYAQRQRYDLSAGASLFLVDMLTSGRWACGERWAFASYSSAIDVKIAGEPVWRERLVLDPADGRIDSPYRCGRFECLATVFIVGPALAGLVESVTAAVGELAVGRRESLVVAGGPLGDGVLVRVAGPSAEACVAFVRRLCAPISDVLGADPWGRKW